MIVLTNSCSKQSSTRVGTELSPVIRTIKIDLLSQQLNEEKLVSDIMNHTEATNARRKYNELGVLS